MAIRITHLDGPLAGQVQQFGNEKERVLIGRVAADADVRFPDDYTAVSREHVVLVQGPGIYRLDLSTDKPVFVDGREALQDQELKGTVELQLGGADGPRLRVEVNPSLSGPTTVKRTAMESVDTRLRGTSRMTGYIGAAVVLVVVAVGVLWYLFQERSIDLRAFVEEQASKQRAAAGVVTPEILKAARDSVYLVVEADASGEAGQGTAWVVGEGRLATNSHVAELGLNLPEGTRFLVRSPAEPYTTHEVTGIELHPGYYAFQTAMAEYDPVVKALGQQVLDAGLIGAYDVAILTVDQPEKLAAPLPIASQAELEAMDAGAPVAYIGYPLENMALSGLVTKPTPQSKIGNLTTVTDYFNIHRKDGLNHLVQHDMGATGGASGSPLINTDGEVVAVLSAVNFIFLSSGEARIPSGASINFAQRADLVRELLDGKANEQLVGYQAMWGEALKLFVDFRSVLPQLILADLKAWLGTETDPLPLREESGTLGAFDEGWGYPVTTYDIDLPEPGAFGFQAIGRSGNPIYLALVQNGEVLIYDFAGEYFAYVATDFKEGGKIQVVVAGQDEGQGYDLKGFYWNYQMVPPPE
jgi:hypothetical protein